MERGQKNEKRVGNKTYRLKEPFLIIPMYKKLVVTDAEGNEEILYEGKSINTRNPFAIFKSCFFFIAKGYHTPQLISRPNKKEGLL